MSGPLDVPTSAVLAAAWQELRAAAPVVQCLVNMVAAPRVADTMLAAGASPAMVTNPHEAGPFAATASGLLVNLGTPYEETVAAMRAAVPQAQQAGTPWVLDPVAAGGPAWRTGIARDLLTQHPTVVRGNAAEIRGLSGTGHAGGVDSTEPVTAALPAARQLSRHYGCVVAVTGPLDHLVHGERTLQLGHGHPWLTHLAGAGCSLGGLIAALCTTTNDPLVAAGTATAAMTLAAEHAAHHSTGPGTFAPTLLDTLCHLDADTLAAHCQLS